MMKAAVLIILGTLLISEKTFSQYLAKISVTVYESKNIPIDSAFVEMYSKDSLIGSGFSDKNGKCTISNIVSRVATVKVTKSKYKPLEIKDIKTSPNKTVYLKALLIRDNKKKGIKLVPVK